MDDSELDIWRVVFDTAVHSMDFGSGFLDDAEVEALRAAARILGVSPDVATPARFRCRFRGHHAAEAVLGNELFTGPDGVWRNAYRRAGDYPADVQPKLKRAGSLGMLVAPVIWMHCGDCGRWWRALDPVPPVNPQVTS
jgi:hypothetical protein